jgi:hypothetical protein
MGVFGEVLFRLMINLFLLGSIIASNEKDFNRS